jgi:hypothetical protein
MGKLINLIGKRFGRLLVIKQGKKDKYGNIYWICECDCEKIIETSGGSIRGNRTTSCGCYNKELLKNNNHGFKHGMRNSKEYSCWIDMKRRCHNINHSDYDIYGKRGILVCDRWLKSFENFYEDIGPRPLDDDYSIERIDVNGNYEPTNCKWASREDQIINRRTTKIKGKKEADHIRKEYSTGEFTTTEIADYYNCDRITISDILQNKTWDK